ncbi:MAG: ChaN family lipoprotein [Bacteroidota bacterium]
MKRIKKQFLAILLMASTFLSFTSDKPAYLLYDQEGKKAKYEKMLKALEEADIIFFGELHTDPIAHWLQIEITKALYEQKQDALMLGAEMFESDGQLIMDEYLSGMYEAKKFEAEMRLWGNYQTDYKPLVEFAKENNIPFIATNIPRRYASMVNYKGLEGLDSLSAEAKRYIAPLPINYDPEVKCYKEMLDMDLGMPKKEMGMPKTDTAMVKEGMEMPHSDSTTVKGAMGMPGAEAGMPQSDTTMAGEGMPGGETAMPGKGGPMHGMSKKMPPMENLPKAQAAKDATMAHFIMENWTKGKTMFHFNGSYHSNNFEGIVWHLKQQNPELKIMTINLVQQEEIDEVSEENLNSANYIICVPESMTRTKR